MTFEGFSRLVKLDHDTTDDIIRQTPARSGLWDTTKYAINRREIHECDALVVCERIREPIKICCSAQRTVFVAWEPATVRSYHERFLKQFGAVVTPHAHVAHPNVIHWQPGLPWTVGCHGDGHDTSRTTLNYDDLSQMQPPEKIKLLSVICSNKTMTEGHRQRLRLLDALRTEFGEEINVYGRGFRTIEDKWNALYPYKYHVVLENSETDDYWTEKLADAFLGFCFPLYSGCKNIARYFPTTALGIIHQSDPRGSALRIREIIDRDTYRANLPGILEARKMVLERHNLFPMLNGIVDSLPSASRERISIHPESRFTSSIYRRAKARIKTLLKPM